MPSNSEPSIVAAQVRAPAPHWAQRLRTITDYLAIDFLGGPRPLKFAWVINFQKAGTFALYGFLLWKYDQRSIAAWIYVAMQGSYGLIWLVKDLAFPDPSWQRKVTIGGAINAFISVLGWYWVFGWLLISGASQPHYPLPDRVWFCLCISMCMIGTTIMVAADAQKYFTLRLRQGLITDGLYRFIRHPNYLGEMLIYASFAMMVWHWLPFLVLAWVWSGLFAVNMIMKEASMSRYPEWQAYRARTGWLLPKLF
jgi:protein-S-isoprenylcysteine O-methyltransferase Ste14